MQNARRSVFLMLLVSGVALMYFKLRKSLLAWGTAPAPNLPDFPGTDLVRHPQMQGTYAIEIQTRPQLVWPWLAQMGRQKTGFYALDTWLNAGIPSAAVVRQDLPQPEVGMRLDNQLKILEMHITQHLVLGNFFLPGLLVSQHAITYSYVLQEIAPQRTRLSVRVHARYEGPFGRLHARFRELWLSLQMILQLYGIRWRAEANREYMADKIKANGNVRSPVRN